MAITTEPPIRAKVTSQGQITVPKAVRDAMDIEPGDEIEFHLGKEVRVRRYRAPSLLSFAGIAGSASRRIPDTAEELDALIAEMRREDARRP